MFLIKVILSLLYCFIRLDSGWGLVDCTAFESGLGGWWSDFQHARATLLIKIQPSHNDDQKMVGRNKNMVTPLLRSQCQGLELISDSLLQCIRTGSLMAWRAVYHQRQNVPREEAQIQNNKSTTVLCSISKHQRGGYRSMH